jgi:hypothetical protein
MKRLLLVVLTAAVMTTGLVLTASAQGFEGFGDCVSAAQGLDECIIPTPCNPNGPACL